MRTIKISNFLKDPVLCYNGYPSPTAQGGMRVVVEPSSAHIGNVPDSCSKLFMKPNLKGSKSSRTPRQEVSLPRTESREPVQLQVDSLWVIYGRSSGNNTLELLIWPREAKNLTSFPPELIGIVPHNLLSKQTVSVQNLTKDTVILSAPSDTKSQTADWQLPVRSSDSKAYNLPDRCSKIWINSFDASHNLLHFPQSTTISIPRRRSWRSLKSPDDYPVRIYGIRTSKSHHKILILPLRNMSSFLSNIPDTTLLSSLLLPGTHDSMAFYGWPISQCQSVSTPLSVQLQSGIRMLDIRLAVINNRLFSYHGSYPQSATFQEILNTIHDFLTSPTTSQETVIMSIKQEDFATTPPPVFSRLVHEEIYVGPGGMDIWFLKNRIPKLGEVRGKIVMFSRFGGDGDGWENGLEGMGIHPTTWPDSQKSGFTWQCSDTTVRTHDWYAIPSFLSIPEKVQLSTQVLQPRPNDPPEPLLNITYFSAASFPLAFPPIVARGFGWPRWWLGVEGVNSRVKGWLLDTLANRRANGEQNHSTSDLPKHNEKNEPEATTPNSGVANDLKSSHRIRGWALMDFYDSENSDASGGVVPLLVELNFG